jgi:ankyrin repeat protein
MTAWNPLTKFIVTHPFNEPEVRSLLPHIDELTDSGSSPLHFAALQNDPSFVMILVSSGAEVNTPNYYLETPLHWAVKEGHQEVVTLLLTLGARVDILDMDQDSPLDWAIQEGQSHLLPLLKTNQKKSNHRSISQRLGRLISPRLLLSPRLRSRASVTL